MNESSEQPAIDSSAKTSSHSFLSRLTAYLQLIRPANVLTAFADILAGFAASGAIIQIIDIGNGWFFIPEIKNLLLLLISTAGLYGGGVVLNDFFDADLDKAERPERPIPSGRSTKLGAFVLGVVLISVGIQSASFASFTSALIAIAIAILAVLYDGWGKHNKFIGPVNMGLCRGGNLLLGMSAAYGSIAELWFLACIPVIYITAVTMVSRGEVSGGHSTALRSAGWLYGLVILFICSLSLMPDFQLRFSLPYLVLFAAMIFGPLRNARLTQSPADIGKAVKFGVLGLILMDASIAAGFGGWEFALVIAFLLPISLGIARIFAVT